jgi:hypothetical protein
MALMDFDKAKALAMAWVEILCEGQAHIVPESTITKPYGWVFFYQANDPSAPLAGNAPIIVNRNTHELRVTGTGRPLEQYLREYERTLPAIPHQQAPQLPTW